MSHSNRVRAEDMHAVFRLLLDCQEIRHDPMFCQRMMIEGLCGLIGARQGAAARFNDYVRGKRIWLSSYVQGGWPDAKVTELWTQWGRRGRFTEDPMVDLTLGHTGPIVSAVRSECIADRVWQRSPFYQQCLRPAQIKDVVVVYFRMKDPGQTFGVAFHRDRNDKLFKGRERDILALFIEEYHRLYLAGRVQYLESGQGLNLSSRQQELFHRLLAGQAPKSIAYELGLSVHTVRSYIRDLYRRVGVSGRSELMAKYAKKNGDEDRS